ncbi:MAG: glycoside hydrolase family 15 protein [Candidatus Geothermincolia bacterium]
MAKAGYLPIERYGIIGDTLTAALVADDGSIDWLCLPRFDSDSVFAAVLDEQRGGHFRIWAEGTLSSSQAYRGWTNVLTTVMESAGGKLDIVDYMPVRSRPGEAQELHRVATCTEGQVRMKVHCSPRPGYAASLGSFPDIDAAGDGYRFRTLNGDYVLVTDTPLVQADGELNGARSLARGEDAHFVFKRYERGAAEDDVASHCRRELEATLSFWEEWAGRCAYRGPWEEAVRRSALVLKLLIYSPSGAIVAAPTTSLPEAIGGERNWDYRYSWLRDASMTLYALGSLGYHDEYEAYMSWLVRICTICGAELQTLFGIDGRRELPESVLHNLAGYRGSLPVRIGNLAYRQFQLDTYGEVLDAVAHHLESGGEPVPEVLQLLPDLVDYAVSHWRDPDNGIWEFRTGQVHYLYSKLMCWVAMTRGATVAERMGLPVDTARWRAEAASLEQEVMEQGWDPERGSFVLHYGCPNLDASLLNFLRLGFFAPGDARAVSMMRAIERELAVGNLVIRYFEPDGLVGDEGFFLLCSCWLADCYMLFGERERAASIIDDVCRLGGRLGLLAEQVDRSGADLLGNYPQAFSHIGLINAVLNYQKAFE